MGVAEYLFTLKRLDVNGAQLKENFLWNPKIAGVELQIVILSPLSIIAKLLELVLLVGLTVHYE